MKKEKRTAITSGEKSSTPKKLSPLLKWAGGKEQELKYILPAMPVSFDDYYEPFVGGGAVYTAVEARHYFINDKSAELISLYRSIKNKDRALFFKTLHSCMDGWNLLTGLVNNPGAGTSFIKKYQEFSSGAMNDDKFQQAIQTFILKNTGIFQKAVPVKLNAPAEKFISEIEINLLRKTRRMKQLEKIKQVLPEKDIRDNIETAIKSAFYMYIRYVYNHAEKYKINPVLKTALFLFIRNYAYSGMFRYNARGEFNVPYGGIGYNHKNFEKKIDYLKSDPLKAHLENTTIENLDFEVFFNTYPPRKNDFVFLDPPYDSEFSTYDQNEFTRADQARLANYLIKKCKAKWMMVIKKTDFISGLYNQPGLKISTFDKTYLVSFMNRNDKNTEHFIITNY